ncbi:MAG TPA: LLM class flavin-dependent oxidoreductase [Candidatus Binataceae bacterium]|nr:LLM class flavin-dependent oxidoreductase [Candidatus Binataceae bacterium]
MQFGIMFDTHVDKWDLIRYAEELGYDRAYVPDSHMIWSDCYVTLGLAAVNTRRIKIGTGIAAPGTRIPPVTAHSIATINQLAPGRVFLGIGSGHTSMRVMGQNPVSIAEMREHVRVVRALLRGEEVDYDYRGKTRPITFLHRDRHFINIDDPIPIYIAANGPRAIELAGETGDGWITTTAKPSEARAFTAHLMDGAHRAGRTLPKDFLRTFVTSVCVLRPGEKLTDERVINETGSQVTCMLHLIYEVWAYLGGKQEEIVPPYFADVWEDYVKRVESYPEKTRFRHIHDGHCTFLQPEERRFVTPEAVAEITITGEPDYVVSRIRAMEAEGMQEVTLLPPADYQRTVFRDFAEKVMPAFR